MNGPQTKKSSFGIDGVLIAIGVVALAGSLYMFFRDDGLGRGGQNEMKPVGQISLSHKDVRRRVQTGFTWSSIASSDSVFEGDSIFTGDDSQAAVDLNTGAQLKIDPKSLIVIKTMGNRLQLDLQYGSLSGRVSNNAPIAFVQNGRLQEISGQDAEIRIDSAGPDGEAKIRVLKGEVQVKSTDLAKTGQKTQPTVQAIRENEVMEINPQQLAPVVKKQQFELLSPQNGKSLWVAPGTPVPFAWRSVGSAAGLNKFEIATDPDFASIVHSEESQASQASVPSEKLPPGAVHWRVRPSDPVAASRVLPTTSKVMVYPDLPPLPTFPEDHQEFASDLDTEGKHKQIEMMWTDKSGSTAFDVELASDENFASVVATDRVTKNNHLTPPLAEGDYFWRVRGVHPERENSPWSRIMHFKVGPEAVAPEVPRLAQTVIRYEIPTSVLSRAPAGVSVDGQGVAPENLEPFKWSEAKDAENYEIEISPSQTFVNSIKHSTGTELAFAPKEVKPGALYVRVRAIGRKGLVSPPSPIGRLEVSLPPPAMKAVKNEVAKFQSKEELEKAKHTFNLAWTPRPFAESYELEWGADASFKQSKKFRMKNTERNISVTKPNSYAARVRALGPGGVPISPFSPVLSASYNKELAVPVAAPPLPVPKKSPASVEVSRLPRGQGPKLQEPLRDTSFVAMEGSVHYVNFRWKATPKASSYEIQISEDADFTKVVETVKARSSRYTLKTELPEGRVFWRVRAVINGTPTHWSDVRDINVLYQ